MKILSLDTATRSCSVAIHAGETLISELTVNHGQTHARVVLDLVDQALGAHRMTMAELDGFAVTTGPGSFTGLRIGLSTVKGFAAATRKPLVGIPTLEVLAYPFWGHSMLICPMLDARKGEIYTAGFKRTENQTVKIFPEQVISPEAAFFQIHEPVIVIGDGAIAHRKIILKALGSLAVFPPPACHTVRAAVVGEMAIRRFEQGRVDSAESLIPHYIRKPDAERNRVLNKNLSESGCFH